MGQPEGRTKTLKIHTLGQFRVLLGDKDLTREYSRSKKPWLLFQFLITNREKSFSPDALMKKLWSEEESKNPQHALSNFIYRLRKKMNDPGGQEYIIKHQGNYCFNSQADYWFDVEEMEKLSRKAFSLPDDDSRKIEYLQKACQLYGGEYLPALAYEGWAFNMRNYCQRLYLKNVRELNRLFKIEGMLEDSIDLCEKALELEPWDENLHLDLIEALIKNNQVARAKSHFKETNLQFQKELEVGLTFNFEEITAQDTADSVDQKNPPLEELEEVLEDEELDPGGGPFLCEPSDFQMLCGLEERRAERSRRNSVLISLKLTPSRERNLSREQVDRKSNLLQDILLNYLSAEEVICPYGRGHFFLLFVGVPVEKIERTLQRIASMFYEKTPLEREDIQIRHRLLVMGGSI